MIWLFCLSSLLERLHAFFVVEIPTMFHTEQFDLYVLADLRALIGHRRLVVEANPQLDGTLDLL